MDLELGLKIAHSVDDHVSSTNFWIAKDKSGPIFVSKETETMFILTAHLNGYRREHVYIDINEDGSQIGISGEKPVQEKVMSGWIMYKKEVEMRGFRKVFRIPDGVVLDRIKAKFNVHESTLTIVMPKSVKGIRGVEIEEVKEDEVDIGRQQLTKPPTAGEVPEKDGFSGKIEEQFGEPERKKVGENRRTYAKGVDEEGSKKEIVADGVIEKDASRGVVQEEAKDSKTQSMQHQTKSVSEHSEELKVAKVKEADGVEKEKVGRRELGRDQVVGDKVPRISGDAEEPMNVDKTTEVTHEVTRSSQETQAIAKHETAEENSTAEPELETPKAGIEEHVRSRPESGESSKLAQDRRATQEEAQLGHETNTDGVSKEGNIVQQLPKQESIEKGHENEFKEVSKHEEQNQEKEEDESSETEEQSDVADEESSEDMGKKDGLEKPNLLCSPFIIAGSALIVSLLVLAINRIRTRKT
ncbi:ESF1 homolog [Pyrus x bretschneideri]|uniref:ESF1 homolog n=1 Tax=Pyrus x bretschneideri TaxID=225117 RepID=UPI00202EB30F|nr:ESF1 homolog [Pyrus x bretschneideri]